MTTGVWENENSELKKEVEIHQGGVLSIVLLKVLLDALLLECWSNLLWELLYAHGSVLQADTGEKVEEIQST